MCHHWIGTHCRLRKLEQHEILCVAQEHNTSTQIRLRMELKPYL